MPGIINGLFAGRSGLTSHGTAISVVGDNIANASTVGYKASRSEFADLLSAGQTAGKVVGAGSQIQAVTPINTQGTLDFTDRSLDLAIDGGGFFAVSKGEDRFYTRAGNFRVDRSGTMVNQEGLAVLGFGTDGTGVLKPLRLDSLAQDGISTQNVSVAGNVNASSTAIDPTTDIPTVDVAGSPPTAGTRKGYDDLNKVAAFSTVAKVYDSLSKPHNITFFFFKDGSTDPETSAPYTNRWIVRGYVNSEEVDTAVPTGESAIATGEPRLIQGAVLDLSTDPPQAMTSTETNSDIIVQFNPDGTRAVELSKDLYDMTVKVPWNNGSDTAAPVNLSLEPFTQYSSPSNILSISQDGRGVGAVTGVEVASDGKVSARFSNGQSSIIGEVAIVGFNNPEGLARVGGNLLREAILSGEPVVGKPGTGKFGLIKAGALELSTVDIANEFVKLISLQRGFQASSRMITTVNQLLNDIIQLA